MSDKPFFSIIIPTKDRAHLVQYALDSVLSQTFGDFECIVVNNSENELPTKEVFLKFAHDLRFKYLRPTAILPMHENWELGLSVCTGKYISVLIDKVMLLPNCFEICNRMFLLNNYEVINWWSDAYNFKNEDGSLEGTYIPNWEFGFAEKYNPYKEIKRRLSFLRPRHNDGRLYFRGKICFGFYQHDLINRMREKVGRVFPAFSPDYTSVAAALSLASNTYDLGMPCCISINSKLSNGQKGENDSSSTINFIKATDKNMKCLTQFPYPNVIGSLHNFVAYDYLKIFNKLLGEKITNCLLNFNLFSLRVQEDLERKRDSKIIVSARKKFILNKLNKVILITDRYFLQKCARKICLEISKYIPIGNRYVDENLHRQFCHSTHLCSQPSDAVSLAHQHYVQFASLPYNVKK